VTNLKSLVIDPVNSSIGVGTKVQLHAIGVYKNKTTKDLTDSVTWESVDNGVVVVGNAPAIKGLAAGSGVGATTVHAKLHGVKGVSAFTVTNASLKSITVVPVNPVVAKGTTVQLAALGRFSDGSVQNLTTQVSWSSANSSIAQVSNTSPTIGLVTGMSAGNTPITATFNGIQGATTVTVGGATVTSITITVPVASIAKGTTVQLTATCNFSDGTTQDCTNLVSWTSGNSGIAQVSDTAPTKGLATGVGVGNTTISGTFGGAQGSATVTVTAATLTSIVITPPGPSMAKGTTVQLTATGNFSDGTTEDLTDQVSWTSADNAIAQVSNVAETEGLVTGLSAGATLITATLNGVEGSTNVTVTAATLTSITITPPTSSIGNGTMVQLTATGTFSDGSTQNLTTQVSWTSGDDTIAQVSNASESEGLVTGVGVGNTSITAKLGNIQGSAAVSVTAAILTSITITPPDPSIAKGTTVQLTATGNFSDGSTEDLTTQVSWVSSDTTIAQVSNASDPQGEVTGLGVGTASITATINSIFKNLNIVTGSTTVGVTAATLTSITITPPILVLPNGTSRQLTATGHFSDNTTQNLTNSVSWTAAPSDIATVAPGGLLTATAPGTATVTAAQGGLSDSTPVTVTAATLTAITITPPNPSLANGTTLQLTATGTYTDGSTQNLTKSVSWGVPAGIVTIDANGLMTATATGSGTISAFMSGIFGTTSVTVTPATLVSITITPTNPTLAKGTTLQLTATGTYTDGSTQNLTKSVSWGVPAGIVTIDANGLMTATATGSGTISAFMSGIFGTTTVTVTPATLTAITITPPNPTLAKGTTLQLTATGTYTDGSTQDLTTSVSWGAPAGVATIDPNGLLTATATGSGTISAFRFGTFGTTSLTVTSAALTSITITVPVETIAKGTTVQLIATGNFTDGSTQDLTDQVSWTSANNNIAQVSDASGTKGLTTGIDLGNATIMATLGSVQGSAMVTVSPAILISISITPPGPSLAAGTSLPLTATGVYSDKSTQDLTLSVSWSAAPTGTVAVGPSGLLTGIQAGNGQVMAVSGSVTGSATVTVTAATLTSITVTPSSPSIAKGTTVQLTATGTFTDGSMQNLTHSVSWTSADTNTATVDPNGLVTGTGVASAAITATQGTVSGSTTVTVTAATVTSIAVTPASSSIAKGTKVLLTATCSFTDSTTQNCTSQVHWTAVDITIAQVSNVSGSEGQVTGLGVGSTSIIATLGVITGSASVTVTAATLTSIVVTPANPILVKDQKVPMMATAVFSDGTMQDVTAQADWSSSDDQVAHIISSSSPETNGELDARKTGTAIITATIPTLGGIQGSTTVTVQ
jgi:uncharacterized protein YjdB